MSKLRRESTVSENREFTNDYAKRLLRRTEAKLKRSADNRSRSKYAAGYRMAAKLVHSLVRR